MPGTPEQLADDAARAAAADAAAAAEAAKSGTPKTFTQLELDAIIADRLTRNSAKFADYDALKEKAARVDKADEDAKTELQRALDKAAKAETEGKSAVDRANATLRRAAIYGEATKQNAVDGDTVTALLAGNATVAVDKDGNVTGAAEAVKALLHDKPFLLKGAPAGGGHGEFGGNDPATLREKITTLERAGKWAEARDLKITMGLTGAK